MSRLCQNCGKETKNKKYCSRSCSASVSNKIPKRLPEGSCKLCGIRIKSSRSYCKPCFAETFAIKDMTLDEATYERGHRSSAFAFVRTRARMSIKMKLSTCCTSCGYTKHIEVCHIKPIANYDGSTYISEINHDDNLIALCRNCHWEFDNN